LQDDLLSLKLISEALRIPISLDTFRDRLLLQKAVYLIQLVGIDMGYRFSWYLRGPYSSVLTDNLFELKSDYRLYDDLSSRYDLADDIIPLIRKCKTLLRKPQNVDLDTAFWYELLASLHYLKHITYIPGVNNQEKTFDIVYKYLPSRKKEIFDRKQAKIAWDFLKKYGLIERKELLAG
jgi:hypothetical protein